MKLGTITKEGKGDVYSYEEDDMVGDPHLITHLAHFGINIQSLEKVNSGTSSFKFRDETEPPVLISLVG